MEIYDPTECPTFKDNWWVSYQEREKKKEKKTVLTNKYLTVILILKACIISYQFPINYIQDANNAQVQTIKWIVLFLAK